MDKLLLHRFLSRRSLVAWLVLALLSANGLRPAQAETRIVQSAKTSFHLNNCWKASSGALAGVIRLVCVTARSHIPVREF